jgi:serine-type D-Ala-D-Ala carboxypeptidase/endopeptidase (penicillin-binding protein 4)
VESAELVELVQHLLETSDNEASEVLARHAAIAEGRPGSFAALDGVFTSVLERLGAATAGTVINDGSGLSRANRLPLRTLLGALAAAADPENPELSGVLAGLPVAGWTGSLAYRFTTDADAGLGDVRAKTGTLTGVHGLAGTVTAADGAVLLFVAVVDRVKVENTLFARDRLDQIAAALAACSCAARTLAP